MATRRGSANGGRLGLMEKRVEYLVGARVRDRKKMAAASQAIDRLRRTVSGWESVEAIRRWRDQRDVRR